MGSKGSSTSAWDDVDSTRHGGCWHVDEEYVPKKVTSSAAGAACCLDDTKDESTETWCTDTDADSNADIDGIIGKYDEVTAGTGDSRRLLQSVLSW